VKEPAAERIRCCQGEGENEEIKVLSRTMAEDQEGGKIGGKGRRNVLQQVSRKGDRRNI